MGYRFKTKNVGNSPKNTIQTMVQHMGNIMEVSEGQHCGSRGQRVTFYSRHLNHKEVEVEDNATCQSTFYGLKQSPQT